MNTLVGFVILGVILLIGVVGNFLLTDKKTHQLHKFHK